MRVFALDGDPVGRAGVVTAVSKKRLGKSTQHEIAFDGAGGRPGATEDVLLRKGTGSSKGCRFRVLEGGGEGEVRARARAVSAKTGAA